MEALSFIDVSGEDDFLLDLASPPPHPDPPLSAGLSSVVGAGASDLVPAAGYPAVAVGKVLDPSGPSDQAPERTESPKKRKAKSGVNLRKSLAWDSAFFTSEGVLDTEELGIVNSTFRKKQGSRLLPGIAEEMRRSGESTTSTLESESFMLESLETELFDNVRASIQRTLGKSDKAPGMHATSSKTPRATTKVPSVAAKKVADRVPQSKIRPPVSASNCGVGSKQRLQVTSKASTAAGMAPPRAAEAKPSLKPPRALPRVATTRAPTNTAAISGISDKRSSTGSVVNRQAAAKSANTSTTMQYRPGGVTKSSSTSKSGALSSAANSHPMGSMPGAKTKSPTLINKNRTAQRVQIRSSSRSDIRKDNPARASRNKIPTRSHGERASPIISPSSSLDSLSSVVSGTSTASTVGKMSHTSESFSTRSSPLSPSLRKSNDQPLTTKSRPPAVTEGQSFGTTWSSPLSPSLRKSNDQPPTTRPRPPAVTEGQSFGTPSVDTLKASKDTTTHGKGARPSGLRRPTPKLGYFDPQEPKTMAGAPHEESSPPQTKASSSLFLRVEQMEVEPPSMAEHEVSMRKTGTAVNADVAKEMVPDLHHNIQANAGVTPQSKASPSLLLRAAQIEVEPSNVAEHEVSMCKTATVVNADAAKEMVPALHHNIQANGGVIPQTKASPSLLHGAAQIEVEPSKVTEQEASMCKTGTLINADVAKEIVPALHQSIQANDGASPSTVEVLSPKMLSASSTFGEQESKSMAAPHEESIPSETKVSPSMPLGVAQMEVEPSKLTEHEASTRQASPVVTVAADTAKENIQPIGVVSPLKENILAAHQNIQGTADASPLTFLTKKLSSVSIADASPMTLLSRKLSSISLGETTDQTS